MNVPRLHLTLLSLLISSLMFIYCQDSITFSPDRAPCVGDTIEMICSIEPPPSETFGSAIAFVSINGSTEFSLTQLNGNSVIDGIDLSRYSADTTGLNPSPAMPVIRLIINSYLPLDSDTIFLCATTFLNGSVYDSTMFGSPRTQADPLSTLEGTTTITILSDCAIHVSFSVSQITSNRLTGLNYTFTLSKEGVPLESIETDTLTPNITLSTTFSPDECYAITVSVENCTNVVTTSPVYFSLQGVSTSSGKLLNSSTDPSRFEWKYNTVTCANYDDLIFTDLSFNLIKDNDVSYPVTEYSLNLPDGFVFYVPPAMQTNEYSLRISLCNQTQTLTDIDIPITLLIMTDNTVTTVLGVLVGLLILLFIVIVILIVLFLIFFYLKRNKNKN